jgi:hypothetical protein
VSNEARFQQRLRLVRPQLVDQRYIISLYCVEPELLDVKGATLSPSAACMDAQDTQTLQAHCEVSTARRQVRM